ncbi:MAG: hypothetical protein HOP29_17710, partial [Phycisphaerales bacterium]|nr:hypothetical protein [Phycisphaerales bacterium]
MCMGQKQREWFRLPLACITLLAYAGGCTTGVLDDGDADDGTSDGTLTTAAKVYSSPAGTSGLGISSGASGAATVNNFDPGAFVLLSSTATETETDEAVDEVVDDDADGELSPAEDGAPPPPPPPP